MAGGGDQGEVISGMPAMLWAWLIRAGWALALFALLSVAPAEAGSVGRCATQDFRPAADGRLLNHLPYAAVSSRDLVRAPTGFGPACWVHRDMLPDLTALVARARADGVRSLSLISCHRSISHQTSLFCRSGPRGMTAVERASQIAPPGFSEHATGYALDFVDATAPRCRLEQCFGNSIGGRWLSENAASFGFEMSFPPENTQGVSSEPWHWRWVGRDNNAVAAQIFAEARTRFPNRASDETATIVPFAAMLAAYAPQPEAMRAPIDPATVVDDDFARNRDPALWQGLSVERVTFKDGRAKWAFWRIANQAKADGPLWVVPHDNENAAFDAALRAVQLYGGVAILIDTAASDSSYSTRFNAVASGAPIDPNRNFVSLTSPYVTNLLADLASGQRLIIALHTNAPGFSPAASRCNAPGMAGSGNISIRLCNTRFRPVASKARAFPFDDDDSLAIIPVKLGSAAADATCSRELSAADYNIVFENVGTSDGSLSNYAALHGLRYINFETRERGSQEPGLGDARARLAAMIEGVMTKCVASVQTVATAGQ